MKKIVMFALVLLGTKALATETLANVTGDDVSITNIHECMMTAWAAAEPTEEQSASAKTMLDSLHSFIAERIETIVSRKRDVMAAWVRHPINLSEVVSTTADLGTAVNPVQDEITSTTVNVINILNVFQRGKFDHAFAECMHK